MASREVRQPGPDHPIEISPFGGRVRVHFGAALVADSAHALVLEEATYPAVFYIPRADARMEHFEPTDHATHCPYKGDASYFTLAAGGERAENAVWSYVDPYPAVSEIAGHLAFYPNKVEIEAVPTG